MTKFDPLTSHRARVAAAERELENAREAMRSRAKTLGMATAGLFGDCAFVSRSSAKQWAEDAVTEDRRAARERREEDVRALKRMNKDLAEGKPSPFAHLAGRGDEIQRTLKNSAQYKIDPTKCDADYLQMRRYIDTASALSKLCKAQGLEFADVFGPGSLASPSSLAPAEKLLGGSDARFGIVADAPDKLAQAIVESGRRRRGESDASTPLLRVAASNDEPVVATAEAIILAGKRRRGEI